MVVLVLTSSTLHIGKNIRNSLLNRFWYEAGHNLLQATALLFCGTDLRNWVYASFLLCWRLFHTHRYHEGVLGPPTPISKVCYTSSHHAFLVKWRPSTIAHQSAAPKLLECVSLHTEGNYTLAECHSERNTESLSCPSWSGKITGK